MTRVIQLDDVSKFYRRSASGHKFRTLKSALLERNFLSAPSQRNAIEALVDVTFHVRKGEAVGLIGSNGSGKSTLLKLVAGIQKPSKGSIRVNEKLAALIELGAGFHPEIPGKDNIYINASILGLSKQEIDAQFDDIVRFSGLEDFIDEPVKFYSSGMYVRLGFSVAIHTNPDILVVDEVLAVGDEAFSHQCVRRIEEFLASGKTLLLVSHSLGLIEEICDRVIWLDHGRLRLSGSPRRVIDAYRESVADAEGQAHRVAKEQREDELDSSQEEKQQEILRWGNREAEVKSVRLLVNGKEQYYFASGESVELEISMHAHQDLFDFVFGVAIATPRGVECWGTNTDLEGFEPQHLPQGDLIVKLGFNHLRLGAGEYVLDVAIHARDGTPYDYHRRFMSFSVTATGLGEGLYLPEHQWQFSEGIAWKDT